MQQSASWKTTAFGIILAVSGFVLFDPETFARWPWVLSLSKYVMLGGFAGLGLAARDFNVRSVSPVTPPLTPAQAASQIKSTAAIANDHPEK